MTKIPSSLKWLVRRRARVKGLIEASERELPRLTKIEQRLAALKADLAALDHVLLIHEIPINGATIPTIWPKSHLKMRMKQWFSYGELGRSILKVLAASESGHMTTVELVRALLLKVCTEHPDQIDMIEEKRFRELVHKRLLGLRSAGHIGSLRSIEDINTNQCEQEWTLPAKSRTHRPEDTVLL